MGPLYLLFSRCRIQFTSRLNNAFQSKTNTSEVSYHTNGVRSFMNTNEYFWTILPCNGATLDELWRGNMSFGDDTLDYPIFIVKYPLLDQLKFSRWILIDCQIFLCYNNFLITTVFGRQHFKMCIKYISIFCNIFIFF